MQESEIELLLEIYNFIETYENHKIDFLQKLNKYRLKLVQIISEYFSIDLARNEKHFITGDVNQDLGVNFGIRHTDSNIIIAEWVFDLQSKTRTYLLFFYLIKESLRFFIKPDFDEVHEAILNICAIVFMTEIFNIVSIDNPLLSAIRAKIYSEEIANLSYMYWDNLLLLLIKKQISFSLIFKELLQLISKKDSSQSNQAKKFLNWTTLNTIKDENTILPIYVNSKLIQLIETMLKLGYDKSSTSLIARKLNTTQKTITKRFKALNESFYTYWRPVFSYSKINLYSYFLRINYIDKEITEKLSQYLFTIPFLKSLYNGYNADTKILYSPTLICPHIIAESLFTHLQRLKKEGLISDFCLQTIRERKHFISITNYPYDPTMKTFEKLIESSDNYLKKFTFLNQKLNPTKKDLEEQISIDYNLLYFISILKSKYLLRARYGVDINKFRDFHLKNNIPITDIEAQTALLYQNELKAKNKSILSFSLYMRGMIKPGANLLAFEISKDKNFSEKKFDSVINKIKVFSFLSQLTFLDRYLFVLPGIPFNHPIKTLIEKILDANDFNVSFYSIKYLKSKYVPLQELYNFDENKWRFLDFIDTQSINL